ncbi:MAG: ankyrin repeat domain-containing protein [Thiolinea sp.]
MKLKIILIFIVTIGVFFWLLKKETKIEKADQISQRWIPVIFEENLAELEKLTKQHDISSQKNGSGQTPLHFACASYRAVDSDREVKKTDSSFKTHERNIIVDYLLSAGADPNTADKNNWTPLHYCVYHGHRQSIQVFMAHQVQSGLQSNNINSALELANDLKYEDIANLLKSGI